MCLRNMRNFQRRVIGNRDNGAVLFCARGTG
jgi:hypothetical protein